jgi:hypothetical protein
MCEEALLPIYCEEGNGCHIAVTLYRLSKLFDAMV